MSNKWHGGKGDAPRSGFDHKKYAENFDKIFNKSSQPVDSKQEKNLKKT
jgi:hypothetical protein